VSGKAELVARKNDPGRAGQFIFESVDNYLLVSTRQWPDWFLFMDELSRVRAEPGEPGPKGHFLLNHKLQQPSLGLSLPPIIQTMYLLDDKDRLHAEAMAKLTKDKDWMYETDMAHLEAMKDEEREAAVAATIEEKERERAKALSELTKKMNQERVTALDHRDQQHAAALAALQAEHVAALKELEQRKELEHEIEVAHLTSEKESDKADSLAQLTKLKVQDEQKEAAILELKNSHQRVIKDLEREKDDLRAKEAAALTAEKERKVNAMAELLAEKEKALADASQAFEEAKAEHKRTLEEKEAAHAAAMQAKKAAHADEVKALSEEMERKLQEAVSNTVKDKEKEAAVMITGVVKHYEYAAKWSNLLKKKKTVPYFDKVLPDEFPLK